MSNQSKSETLTTTVKPLITIVGVLGKQGLSAAHSLIESGLYRVRGITRRINSPEAVNLVAKGVDLVNIPLDLGYYEEYVSAFHGSNGVFLMTPQITPPATHEYMLGKELADAAVEAGVGHIIFSSLENIDKISGGELFAPHFTDKARIEEYIRTLPIPSSFIYMAFFYTNLIEFYTPYQENDTLVFPIYLPKDFKAPFVDPLTATGPAVLEIFSKPEVYTGKGMPVIGDIISPQELVETFVRVTGKKAVYSSAFTSVELLQHFPEFSDNNDLIREFSGMVEFAVKYGYFQENRDMQWSRRINPNSLNWEQFLKKTGWTGEKRIY